MQFDIEAYLNGELSDSERAAFEAELTRNPDLRAEMEAMRPVLLDLARIRLKNQVEKAATNRRHRRRARQIAVLLSLGFGFLGGLMWWKYVENRRKLDQKETPIASQIKENVPIPTDLQNELAPNQLKTQNLKFKTNDEIASNENLPKENRNYRGFADAETLDAADVKLADVYFADFLPYPFINMNGLNLFWKKNDFQGYYHYLESLEADKGENPSSILLKSACLLKMHRPAAAKMGLFQIRGKNTPESREAEWLLALAFLMEGKRDSAVLILEKMTKTNAKRLLDEI